MDNATGVVVSGESLHDVKQKIMFKAESRPYISIEPIEPPEDVNKGSYTSNDLVYPKAEIIKVRPTTSWRICWTGWNESFTREVHSNEELQAVLKPILQEHKNAQLMKISFRARERKRYLKEQRKQFLEEAKACEVKAKNFRKAAKDCA